MHDNHKHLSFLEADEPVPETIPAVSESGKFIGIKLKADPASPLGWSSAARLLWAAGVSALLWLAVAWAIGWLN